MTLQGTVTNVAQFGAFVDLGVHQDGLVHVSQLAHKFVKDAREVVKTGDSVKVKVLEVDLPRKRIALTLKLDAAPQGSYGGSEKAGPARPVGLPKRVPLEARRAASLQQPSALAEAFSRLKNK